MLITVFDLYFNLMSRERNNVWLFYNPWFPLQKSIRLISCYTSSYLIPLIFCLFCFIKKKQKRSNNIFSQRLLMLSFLSHNPRSDCSCSPKFISTGMQSRFSNTVAKFQHENMSVHYISRQNIKSEAQLP